jgi:hypothetical protein
MNPAVTPRSSRSSIALPLPHGVALAAHREPPSGYQATSDQEIERLGRALDAAMNDFAGAGPHRRAAPEIKRVGNL